MASSSLPAAVAWFSKFWRGVSSRRIWGVSLYTWTSIIGVILAGITFGNYLGGLLADRMASRALLRRIFLYSALTVVATVVLAPTAADRIASAPIPLMLRIVLATAAAFLIPSTAGLK